MARCSHHRSRGQALPEFALVLPLFFLILFGMLDIGRIIWANDALSNAAREGTRFASVGGSAAFTPDYTKPQIRDHTRAFAFASGINVTVTVCYSTVNVTGRTVGCSGDTDQSGMVIPNGRGNLVTVAVSSTVPLGAGGLLGLSNFPVSASSTALINN